MAPPAIAVGFGVTNNGQFCYSPLWTLKFMRKLSHALELSVDQSLYLEMKAKADEYAKAKAVKEIVHPAALELAEKTE